MSSWGGAEAEEEEVREEVEKKSERRRPSFFPKIAIRSLKFPNYSRLCAARAAVEGCMGI